jgi:hypothetical protein
MPGGSRKNLWALDVMREPLVSLDGWLRAQATWQAGQKKLERPD